MRRIYNTSLILLIALAGGGLAGSEATAQDPSKPPRLTDNERKQYIEMIQAQAAKSEEARRKELEQNKAAHRETSLASPLIALAAGRLVGLEAGAQEPPKPPPMTDEQRKKFIEMIQAQAAKSEEARRKEAEQKKAAQGQPPPVQPPPVQPPPVVPPGQQPVPGPTAPAVPAPQPGVPATGLMQRPSLSADQVQLTYDNADLYDFVNQIADTLGLTPIIIDPNIKGTVTIHSTSPMSKDDVFPLFHLILKNNNAALVKQGNIYQIVPISDALKRGLELIEHRSPETPVKPSEKPKEAKPPAKPEPQAGTPGAQPASQTPPAPDAATTAAGQQPPAAAASGTPPTAPQTTPQPGSAAQQPKLSTHVIRAEFISVRDLIEPLKLFMTEGGVIMPYDRLNMLIITDYTDNVQKIMDIIRLLDDAFINPELIELLEIKYNASADIADDLKKIFGSGGKDSPSGIYFVPLDRMNAILVMANSKRALGEFKRWVEKLDATTGRSVQTYIYTVENSTASNIMLILTALFGGEGGGGGTSPSGTGRSGGGGGAGGTGGGTAGGFGSGGAASSGGGAFGAGMGGQSGGGMGGYGGGQYGGYGGGFGGQGYGGYGGGGYGGYGGGGMGGYGGGGMGGYGGGGMGGYGGYGGGGGVFGGGSQLGPRLNQAPAMSSQIFRGGPLTGLQESVRIVANDVNNTLVIQASPADYAYLLDVIKKLDVLPRQVIIDARIFEVDLTNDLNFGIQAILQARTTDPHLTTGRNPDASGALSVGTFAFVGDAREILLNLSALRKKTKVKVLEAPSVLALDGTVARIVVGGEVPYLGGTFFGGVGGSSSSVQYRDTGISLIVMPRISGSGVVTMDIAQEVSTQGAAVSLGQQGSTPSFNKSGVSTTLAVKDGETVAIAGLIRDNYNTGRSGVPFFSEIPILGSLFGSTTRTNNRTELLILISPHVIRTPERFNEMTQDLKDSLRNVRKFVDDKQKEHLQDMEDSRKARYQREEKLPSGREKKPGQPQSEPPPVKKPER